MKLSFFLAVLLLALTRGFAQKGASVSFEKWISLKSVGSPLMSPDGKTVVYSISSTDWANNSYDSELWMWREGSPAIQLTRTQKGSSFAPRFTPDSKYVSFVADRGDKNQLYLISVNGGEAMQVTKDPEGIGAYEWNPAGTKIALVKTDPESKEEKEKKERYGAYAIEGEEYRQSHIWILNFHMDSIILAGQVPCYPVQKDSTNKDSSNRAKTECVTLPSPVRLTSGNYHVNGFAWRPDGNSIIFNRQSSPLILAAITSDILMIDIISKKIDTLVKNPVGDFFSRWSPDGRAFIYSSAVDDSTTNFFSNNRLFHFDIHSRKSREIATDIDENKFVADWNSSGLYLSALQKTKQKLYTVDLSTGKSKAVDILLDLPSGMSFSKNADVAAVSGRNYADLNEIYIWKQKQPLLKITASSEQIAKWNTPVNEVINWKSQDGADIEGVLLKPKNFDSKKKYPLLVVIHGGPTGIDLPDPTPSYVYPMMQWVEKGALILRVNYRGSAGYGAKFRALNVRNLGVGDMWDVVSGVEHLSKQGYIDTAKMGCMGWSQGGYISAFLTTNTNIFKAISVGAGISNWVTYYVNTDITPFTQQYLKATPWNDMEVYLKTSPMTNINKASTPTLIQHGEFDRRVPIPNAYELYRGLQDRNVPSQLIVYKGFGHGINKPKERLAAVWHNWDWFEKWVFGQK